MFRRHTPVKLLIAVIAIWGLSVIPQSTWASGSKSPQVIQQGGIGGSDLPDALRINGMQTTGDPDEYTQTGGSNPKPAPGGVGNSIYAILLGYLRSWFLLGQGILFR